MNLVRYGFLLVAFPTMVTSIPLPPTISLMQPQGIRFVIPDQTGLTLIGLHYSINTPLSGTAPGQYNYDIKTKTNGEWVHENTQAVVGPGDSVNYWIYQIANGLGSQLLNQAWIAGQATTPTTNAPVTTTTTPKETTTASPASPGPPGQSESQCSTYPCLIFEDEFDSLNLDVWEHEITAGGGGNWEFQYYTNNRTNSYVRDGKLFIKPTLTAETLDAGPDALSWKPLDLWGSQPGDVCTGNQFWGCKRNAYGGWPASGEIDIVEVRGNRQYTDDNGNEYGIKTAGSTLHFGSDDRHNKWPTAHGEKSATSGTYGDSFHKYVLIWDENHISISIDDTEVLNVAPIASMWQYGGLDQDGAIDNPWQGAGKMAPFDQEFFLVLNVAVGDRAYFPDSYNNPTAKPWSNTSPTAARDFWEAREDWYHTWNPETDNGEGAAVQIKYIKVFKLNP